MADSEDPKKAAIRAVQNMMDLYFHIVKTQDTHPYDLDFMKNIRLVDAGPEGKVEFEFTITPFYANLNGVMHGGAAGVIFDMATTLALCPIQKLGYWDFLGGVTRTLNISYLRAVPLDKSLRLRAHVIQHGRTMALIRGTLESWDGNLTYAVCEHHKVNLPTLPEHLELRQQLTHQMLTGLSKPKL